jgi:virginiamycin B lyase
LVLAAAGAALLLVPAALAATIGMLKQYKVPTAGSSPNHITQGSDGNFWFTESWVLPPQPAVLHNVGRITPAGQITEFPVCDFCFPNDIAQGPNGILYFTKSDTALGRVTTSGQVLSDVQMSGTFHGGSGITAHGDDIWFTDFNSDSIGRYTVSTGTFTQYFVPPGPEGDPNPLDVVVGPDGIVWFTPSFENFVGRLDPQSGVVTEIPTVGDPRNITVAVNGTVWFTELLEDRIGRLDPATNQVTEFQLAADVEPVDIAPAPDGSLWFTQSRAGNIARITTEGVVTGESRAIKDSQPDGITVAASGNPWFTEMAATKIAVLGLK